MGKYNLYRLANTQIRKGASGEKGTGLGLIACKELLEMHESTLHVDSEEGKGSRFFSKCISIHQANFRRHRLLYDGVDKEYLNWRDWTMDYSSGCINFAAVIGIPEQPPRYDCRKFVDEDFYTYKIILTWKK